MRSHRVIWLFFVSLCEIARTAISHAPGHHGAPHLGHLERTTRADYAEELKYLCCSEQDVLVVLERSARQLERKFDGAMKDVKMLAKLIVQSNQRGGDADPVLRKDMCCCTTVDWEDLGRSSAWAGYHDCDENRMNELYYGNMSLNGGYGVFTGTRTIDTDLAFLSPAATVFPWIIERQTVSFDRDGFFAAAWMGTNGEVRGCSWGLGGLDEGNETLQ
eukprot:3291809-Rhodomonas_salina.2